MWRIFASEFGLSLASHCSKTHICNKLTYRVMSCCELWFAPTSDVAKMDVVV